MTDEEISEGVRVLLNDAHLLAEPAGAAAFAALLHRKIPVRPDEKVVCVVSGGNMGLARLKTFLP